MMNFRLIRHLWSFLAVAEEKNFGRAAKRLGMTQPPLTEQIQTLEAALKVQLFERTKKGTSLTAAGQAILPEVEKMAAHWARLEASLHEALQGQKMVLTFGAITSAMVDILPAVITHLKMFNPELTIFVKEVDSSEVIPMLQQGELDCAFARLDKTLHETNSLHIEPITKDKLAIALPMAHRLASQPMVHLAELAEDTFVMFPRPLNSGYFDTLMACYHQHGFTPRILHEARTVASQVALVGCGQGVALVPSRTEKLAPANVIFRPLAGDISVITTSLVWQERPNNRQFERIIQEMIHFIHEQKNFI